MLLVGPLLAYVLWTLLLVSVMVSWRGISILRRERKIQEFPSGERHGHDVYWRINRAHLNALENLPMFAAVVLAAFVLVPPDERRPYELAAHVVLFARMGQSIVHIAFHTAWSVTIRFTCFATQAVAFAFMAVKLLMR